MSSGRSCVEVKLYNALTAGTAEIVRNRRHRSTAALTQAVFSIEGNTITSGKRLSETQRKTERLQNASMNKSSKWYFFTITCKWCTQSRSCGMSSPKLWPPLLPRIPHSCCRASREVSGSPVGTGSCRFLRRSHSEPNHSHTLHMDTDSHREDEMTRFDNKAALIKRL